MTVHQPTLKQLQYLVALREHGHFGRAANACYVTQSTLSAGLRELETLLGITLVERTRRVVRFTALGEKIADKAVKVLRESEELAELARAEGRPLGRVGRSAHLAVGQNTGQIKTGSFSRTERVAKYNELLRIAENDSLHLARPFEN